MALLSRGRLREGYSELGAFALRYVTILMSEDTQFVFLSEDESDILIAEINEIAPGLLRRGYGSGGDLPTASIGGGMIKESYITKGTYEREDL